MSMLRVFIFFVAFAGMVTSGSMASAQNVGNDRPRIPLELYGQIFSVEPTVIDGAKMTYQQLKDYAPTVLVSMHTQERTVHDVAYHLENMAAAYEDIFNMAVENLARRIKHFVPQRGLISLEHEVADYLRAGKWKSLSDRYKKYSKTIAPQVLEAQQVHNKYLSIMYLSVMVDYSPEYNATVDEDTEDHSHTIEEVGYPTRKYENGYGYTRRHKHDMVVPTFK